MKKLFFILSILSIVFLFSFSKKSTYPPVKIQTKSGSCSIPTGLAAVKNGSQVTLSWSSDPVNCSYGGYFNTPNGYVTFGGSTNTWPKQYPAHQMQLVSIIQLRQIVLMAVTHTQFLHLFISK